MKTATISGISLEVLFLHKWPKLDQKCQYGAQVIYTLHENSTFCYIPDYTESDIMNCDEFYMSMH